jgi:hypothetical protein
VKNENSAFGMKVLPKNNNNKVLAEKMLKKVSLMTLKMVASFSQFHQPICARAACKVFNDMFHIEF